MTLYGRLIVFDFHARAPAASPKSPPMTIEKTKNQLFHYSVYLSGYGCLLQRV